MAPSSSRLPCTIIPAAVSQIFNYFQSAERPWESESSCSTAIPFGILRQPTESRRYSRLKVRATTDVPRAVAAGAGIPALRLLRLFAAKVFPD